MSMAPPDEQDKACDTILALCLTDLKNDDTGGVTTLIYKVNVKAASQVSDITAPVSAFLK